MWICGYILYSYVCGKFKYTKQLSCHEVPYTGCEVPHFLKYMVFGGLSPLSEFLQWINYTVSLISGAPYGLKSVHELNINSVIILVMDGNVVIIS